jgi:hypothetical protein
VEYVYWLPLLAKAGEWNSLMEAPDTFTSYAGRALNCVRPSISGHRRSVSPPDDINRFLKPEG